MATSTAPKKRKKRIVQSEEAGAWFEYLDRIAGLNNYDYDQVEPHAWKLLQKKLADIDERKVMSS